MNRDYVHEGLENAEEEQVERTYLGVADTQIVGIQHYDGIVSNRELVTFRRQPANPYDRNAVQVLNTLEQQVGHLPRTVVLHLAPHLDSKALALEAVIPRGSKNKYKIPVKLFVYAANDQIAAVRNGVRNAGLSLQADSQAERILDVSKSPSKAAGGASGPRVNAAEVSNHLSLMFEELLSEERSVASMAASTKVQTQLMPHQCEALAWMVQRENGAALPPFWEPHKVGPVCKGLLLQ